MTLELVYAGFAEGATMDYRGNIAVVGFAMPFLAVQSFPLPQIPSHGFVIKWMNGGTH
jgi:hypothetical protein